MNSNKNVANAVGARTARACDSCIKNRARFYCVADDTFLCQPCDSSVHSANPLAHRHERVRIKTTSLKCLDLKELTVPSWHRGFTKKTRTPRHGKGGEKTRNHVLDPLVPEVGSEDVSLSQEEVEEEHLLYRVPIFDPLKEMCTSTTPGTTKPRPTSPTFPEDKNEHNRISNIAGGTELKASFVTNAVDETIHGFTPSDIELAEFAADVESLLGKGLENESFAMEELGLTEYSQGKVKKEEDVAEAEQEKKNLIEHDQIKEVKEHECGSEIDLERELPFQFTFDYDYKCKESPATCGEDNEKVVMVVSDDDKRELNSSSSCSHDGDCDREDTKGLVKMKKKRKALLLKLDYEAVITAWASQGSPWTSGNRPDFDSDECWPDCMGSCVTSLHHTFGDPIVLGMQHATVDGGREARVSRYREKRRTRLFSKKIRYEVRKLNAEKRPRMKGRFVKRANFAGAAAFPLLKK